MLSQAGDLALLVSREGKQFLIRLQLDQELQTHRGVLRHADLIGIPWGSRVSTHTGVAHMLFRPSMRDVLRNLKRTSQIIFPKDLGYILLQLSVGPGSKVLEAGTGSGALTCALAWAVGPTGRVYSYDRREDMQNLARRNLDRLGLLDRVSFHLADVAQGFEQRELPALFLDLPQPHQYLPQAHQALCSGGALGAILPTSNQVSQLIEALGANHFGHIEVCELLLRFYKPMAERLRPADRMIGHTGYLVFARALIPGQNVEG